MRVVVNKDWGGFGLSDKARQELRNRGVEFESDYQIDRANPHLVELVETWPAEDVNDNYSCLQVVNIPDGINYYIENYDGIETIHEVGHSW